MSPTHQKGSFAIEGRKTLVLDIMARRIRELSNCHDARACHIPIRQTATVIRHCVLPTLLLIIWTPIGRLR